MGCGLPGDFRRVGQGRFRARETGFRSCRSEGHKGMRDEGPRAGGARANMYRVLSGVHTAGASWPYVVTESGGAEGLPRCEGRGITLRHRGVAGRVDGKPPSIVAETPTDMCQLALNKC